MNSKKLILIVFFAVSTIALRAQDDLDDVLAGSVADAEYLLKGYSSPLMKVMGYGLNQGWYNTAATHKLAGFDFTITGSAVYFPTSDLYYQVDNNALKNLILIDPPPSGGVGSVPTIFGPENAPTYQNKTTGTNFSGPPGVDVKGNIGGNYIPLPMVQIGFGLPKGFELKMRFMPKTNVGDNGDINMIGFGVVHDIKQYIPGIKELPFDLSAFVGFTRLKLDVGLDSSKPDQHAVFETNSTTIQGLVSKKIAVLTVYGALGYNIAKTNLSMLGSYEFENPAPAPPTILTDPVKFDVSANGMRATGGLRLQLAIFTLHVDYTLQKYKVLTAGLGISFR
ncbi:MAG: DUF6588 family protein [Bacteroidota bacterium]